MLRISLNNLNLISLMHDVSDTVYFFLNLGKLKHLPEFRISGQCETELEMTENRKQ